MKKILLSLVICLGLVSFASQTFAQSTQVNPYDGSTHTYGFDNVEVGANYEFYVSTSTAGYGMDDKLDLNEYGTMVNVNGSPTSFPTVSTGTASVKITWANDATGKYGLGGTISINGFYLYLKVTTSGTNCDPVNYKAVHIMPVLNNFNVTVADLGAVTNPSCADILALQPVINNDPTDLADETHYDPGTTTMSFEIERKTGTNPWSGGYTVACSEGTVPFKINTGVVSTVDKTGIITSETGSTVTVTVVMTNTPGVNPIFTLTMTSASDDTTGLGDLTLESDSHTINLMPKIGDFIGS